MVVIASASRPEDPGFEFRQGMYKVFIRYGTVVIKMTEAVFNKKL
jgi:hypothetical protein